MNVEEYKVLENDWKVKSVPLISVDDFRDKNDRVLLIGCDGNYDDWEVCLVDGVIYTTLGDNQKVEIKSNEDYIPNGQLWTKRCDFEFCRLLKSRGVSLPLIPMNEKRT